MANQTLFDAFQIWLQGEINTAVAGHASRIERLEERLQTQDAAIKALAERVQAMLVPETMCADDLLEKIRGAEDWGDALEAAFELPAFEDAVKDVVSSRELREMVKDIISDDIRFDVSVR